MDWALLSLVVLIDCSRDTWFLKLSPWGGSLEASFRLRDF